MDSIYSLLSAMKGQQRQMSAVSNNLANVNTTGYKADEVVFREYYSEFIGQDLESEEEMFASDGFISPFSRGGTSFVMPDHVSPSMKQGMFKHTNNPFDFSIQTEGFFVVETPQGARYTRNGQFLKDAEGFLITNAGHRVMGKEGPLKVEGQEFSVGRDGSVMIDGQEVGFFKIVNFEEPGRLTKLGNSYWVPGSDAQKPIDIDRPVIHQGTLEGSNVEVVQEMVKMIGVNRSYEASQKAMKSLSELGEKSISIARV